MPTDMHLVHDEQHLVVGARGINNGVGATYLFELTTFS